MESPVSVLQQYFGFPYFRPGQEEVVNAVLAGHDALALMPTGGGKSLCYQVPALCKPGLCLVVSPLVALMRDQVERLRSRGIAAFALHAGQKAYEQGRIFEHCLNTETDTPVKFLYLSPERLESDLVRERISQMDVNLLAVDEAHCISQWGHEFRPSYRNLAQIRQVLPKGTPCLALTATATRQVAEDIRIQLSYGKDALTFEDSFARPGLSLSTRYSEDKDNKLAEIVKAIEGPALVYVRSRTRCQELADFLRRSGHSADYYHAGLQSASRAQRQDRWMTGRTRIMVATTAFGMGIDKADVRLVVHMNLPEGPEAYYQEAGRAGRDGQRSYAVVLFNRQDLYLATQRVEEAYPDGEFIRRVYQALANFLQVPVGTGEMQSFDFDLDKFQVTFGLPPRAMVGALDRLEGAGLIARTDSYRAPGRVQFLMDFEQLYDHQLRFPATEPLLKTMLRLFGGRLFTDSTAISEQRLGSDLGQDAAGITRQLQSLAKGGLLRYELPSEHPQLTFLTQRYAPEELPLRAQNLDQRREVDLTRARAMVSLVTEPQACRMVRLVGYFGQTLPRPCGVCDNCLRRAKEERGAPAQHSASIEARVLATLPAEGDMTIASLLEALPTTKVDAVLSAVRGLVGEGRVVLEGDRIRGV